MDDREREEKYRQKQVQRLYHTYPAPLRYPLPLALPLPLTIPPKAIYLFYCPYLERFLFVTNQLDCVLTGSKPGNWETIKIKKFLREGYESGIPSLTSYSSYPSYSSYSNEPFRGRVWFLDSCSGYERIFKPSNHYPYDTAYLLTVDSKKLKLEERMSSKELYCQIGIPEDYLNQINLSNIPDTKHELQDQLYLDAKQPKLEKRQSDIKKIANAMPSLDQAEKISLNAEPSTEFQERIQEINQLLAQLKELDDSNTKALNVASELLEQLKIGCTERISEVRELFEEFRDKELIRQPDDSSNSGLTKSTKNQQTKKENKKEADRTCNKLLLHKPNSTTELDSEKVEQNLALKMSYSKLL